MIAITGAPGQLGTALAALLPEAILLTRDDLDLSEPKEVSRTMDKVACSLLINCAAYTAVDNAESDDVTAMKVNGQAVGELAAWAASNQARFITYSTDYVFSGQEVGPYVESDPINPQSVYGHTKAAGEAAALAVNPQALVIRTSWLISGTHRNFVSTMIALARDQQVPVVDDQNGRPTIVKDLAQYTIDLLGTETTGILHAANQGTTTWFGLAQAAVELAGINPKQITPCSTAEFPRPAPRPKNSELGSEIETGISGLPPWSDSLPEMVTDILEWI